MEVRHCVTQRADEGVALLPQPIDGCGPIRGSAIQEDRGRELLDHRCSQIQDGTTLDDPLQKRRDARIQPIRSPPQTLWRPTRC